MQIKISNIVLELSEGFVSYSSEEDLLVVEQTSAPNLRPPITNRTSKPLPISALPPAPEGFTRSVLVRKILLTMQEFAPSPTSFFSLSVRCLGRGASKKNKLYLTLVMEELVEAGTVEVGPPDLKNRRSFLLTS